MNLHPVVLAAHELQLALEDTDWVDDEAAVDFLLARFRGRRPDTREFALRARVLLLRSSDDVHLDVALGALDFERRSIERASDWAYHDVRLRTCSAEDLIVHKAFASRDQDWVDVECVLMAQGRKLDVRQIFAELRPLADLKEDPTIVPRLEALMRKRDVID